MRLKANKILVLLGKNDLLDTIGTLKDPNVRWCTLTIMFETQDVTRKLNLYAKFSDVKMQEGTSMTNFVKKFKEIKTNMAIVGEVLINDRLVHAMLHMLPCS
jgi:hypothetical protein